MFLLDFSAFMIPMEEWNSTHFGGRQAYYDTLPEVSIKTKFGTITIDPTEMIVLPANVVSSSSSKDVIIYYTAQDVLKLAPWMA